MIYFCADDYGLSRSASANILQLINEKSLNKVSVFPNFDKVDLKSIPENVRASLHLNLVEGKCRAPAEEISLIADKDGKFKHTFIGLLLMNLFRKKELEAQLYREIKAQVLLWKSLLPENAPFCVDSHQHTHMIPAVFNSLLRVLEKEGIDLEYIRIPAEPLLPYIKTPSLYFTYSPINILKQWLLKLLWLINKRKVRNTHLNTALFFGILFSGRMDSKRVSRVLPKYIALAEKEGKDIEVLFHPGHTSAIEVKKANAVFEKFYLSPDRKTEFDSVKNISERSVQK